MPDYKPPRPGEVAIDLPRDFDAGVYFIGRIRTPWPTPLTSNATCRPVKSAGSFVSFAIGCT